jgi:hypothetical protein
MKRGGRGIKGEGICFKHPTSNFERSTSNEGSGWKLEVRGSMFEVLNVHLQLTISGWLDMDTDVIDAEV